MRIDPSLPGADLVEKGLADAAAGNATHEALLVAIGAPRLRRVGLDVPELPDRADRQDSPEAALYGMLARADPATAHSRYNALLRRLISCERALEREHGHRIAAT